MITIYSHSPHNSNPPGRLASGGTLTQSIPQFMEALWADGRVGFSRLSRPKEGLREAPCGLVRTEDFQAGKFDI